MFNNAGERSEARFFCIFNHQIWKNSEIRTFLFFLPILGGGANVPSAPPPESATDYYL